MDGLNFIVGGIPRSGTTAFADALNRHPEIFCYASESNLLPFAQQIGSSGHIPPVSIPRVREWLREELRLSLIDMVEQNIAAGSPKPAVRFNKREIAALVSDTLKDVDFGGDSAKLAANASSALARKLRQKSGKTFVGEKTPANVLALDALADGPNPLADPSNVFLVVRRPFSVICSMRARLSDKTDHFTSSFSGDAAQQAAYYLRYAFACGRMARRGAHILRYESFAGNARRELPKVLSVIGASANGRIIEGINRQIECRTRGDYRNRFSLAEQAIIDCVTEAALAQLGYGRDPRSRSSEAVLPVGYRVLSGGHDDKMLDRRAVVMLVAEPQHKKARLRFWYKFPGTVVDAGDMVCWNATDVEGRNLGAVSAAGGGPSFVDLSITLDPIRGTRCANGNVVHVIEVGCSHAFVPLVHPFRTSSNSEDRREVSGQLLSVDFA